MPDLTIQEQINREVSRFGSVRPATTHGTIPVPAADVASLLRSVQAVKRVLDAMIGAGSAADRAVRVDDLLPAGATSLSLPDFYLNGGGSGGGGGGGGGLGYTDPRPILTTPPTLTNLQAAGAFENIILTWERVAYQNHAYVEVWRSTGVNALGSASLLGTTVSDVYADNTAVVGPTYYYWVRAAGYRPSDGTILFGDYNAVSGVSASLAPDTQVILDSLEGQITESQLYTDLGTALGPVDQLREDADTAALSAAVNAYNETRNRAADILAEAKDRGAAIGRVETLVRDVSSSLATSIDVVSAAVNANNTALSASIVEEKTARADLDGSVAALYTLRTELSSGGQTIVGGFGLSATSTAAAGPRIDFGVRANRFWVAAPSSAGGLSDIQPFVIQTTPTTINGVAVPAGVYMDAAYILNGSITNAKIGNAAIDDAKIANAAITNAKIANGEITNAKIADATITDAKIVSLDGDKITANSVTAGKMSVGTLSELSPDAGIVTAGVLRNAGNTSRLNLNATGTTPILSVEGKLVIRADGDATFSGDLSAAGGTFAGNLSAAGGTFAGNLSAAGGTFAGNLSAAGGTFSGTLTASAINAVDTINIADNAVSVSNTASGTAATVNTSITVPSGQTWKIIVIGFQNSVSVVSSSTATLSVTGNSVSLTPLVTAVDVGDSNTYAFSLPPASVASVLTRTAGTHTLSVTGEPGAAKTVLAVAFKK